MIDIAAFSFIYINAIVEFHVTIDFLLNLSYPLMIESGQTA